MEESTFWWLLAGLTIACELMTGTFYLLMLALGPIGAALSAKAGAGVSTQITVAALIGAGAVVIWRWWRLRNHKEPPAQANPDVNMDVGQLVHVAGWSEDESAQVHYRGANWTALRRADTPALAGEYRIVEVVGSRLLVEKT